MEESTADGIIVSVGDFKENFGIAPSKQKRNIKNLEKVECEIRNIQIDKELLGLEVELKNVDDENEYISMFGNLRASYKAQNGINSTIVEVFENTNGYEVLLFEIFNDTTDNNLLVNKTLGGQEHVKIYLKENNGNIYLLELKMIDDLAGISAEDYPEASKKVMRCGPLLLLNMK